MTRNANQGNSKLPVAQPVQVDEQSSMPMDTGTPSQVIPTEDLNIPLPNQKIFPPFPHLCSLSLPQGCYQFSLTTHFGKLPVLTANYRMGTLRVEKNSSNYVISGDTYRYSFYDLLTGQIPGFSPTDIPIYPRSRYASYLKVTNVVIPKFSFGTCGITLYVDEYDYTQPPAGSYDGTFPATPTRSLRIFLTPATPPVGYTGVYFTGQVYIGGTLQSNMSVTLAWISPFYRKATIELHTMSGAVSPSPVSSEFFDTIYAKANWKLSVVTDPNVIPAPTVAAGFPAGWTGTSNWGSPSPGYALLHKVMTSVVDYASVDLDKQWYMHVLFVQAALGDGRGVMFDSINVPREGVASFSDDGYPTGDSSHFGTAANQEQRNVPRAFLRSATHEITHGFNQVHQENEGGGDNSIMTTSPGVADYLAAHGQAFPNDINLDFNAHVRHHLVHMPDIVIRPGGMSFTAGHNGTAVPSSDESEEIFIEHPALKLNLTAKKSRVKIGEPLELNWEIINTSDTTVRVPNDVSIGAEFAEISVTKPTGDVLEMPPYVIKCDSSSFTDLPPKERLSAQHHLFWSTQGFAFETPGRHTVNLEISWGKDGATIGVQGAVDVLVDYPVTEKDNDIIAHMMHDEVGKFIALGGHAYHLKKAVKHIEAAIEVAKGHPVSTKLVQFYHKVKVEKELQ